MFKGDAGETGTRYMFAAIRASYAIAASGMAAACPARSRGDVSGYSVSGYSNTHPDACDRRCAPYLVDHGQPRPVARPCVARSCIRA